MNFADNLLSEMLERSTLEREAFEVMLSDAAFVVSALDMETNLAKTAVRPIQRFRDLPKE